MSNLTAMFLVVMVIVIGIGACWAITANGSTTGINSDSFGNTPPASTIHQDNATGDLATKTMVISYLPFFIAICVIIVSAIAWLYSTGKSKGAKY